MVVRKYPWGKRAKEKRAKKAMASSELMCQFQRVVPDWDIPAKMVAANARTKHIA
jgi:hypothetical protein